MSSEMQQQGQPNNWGRLRRPSNRSPSLTIDLVLVIAENDSRRGCLLQTFEQIHHLRFLLDVLNFLNDVERRGTSSTDVDNNRLHERLLGEVLDTFWHRS